MSPVVTDARYVDLLNTSFRDYQGPPFSICIPGQTWNASPDREPVFSLVFRDSTALRKLWNNPTELGLGEAFIRGDFNIEGDIFSAFEFAEHLFARHLNAVARSSIELRRLLSSALETAFLGRRHSKRRDRGAISYHYDHPAKFFQPWLGSSMAYSCAYFRNVREDLDRAQTNKLDLICRKLELRPEDSILDIGCGWGSLVMYAAGNYGADARGVTLSKQQAQFAAAQIVQKRMTEHCFVEMRDYRDLPQLPYRYDKIASVGMFEHVGRKNLPRYFQIAYDLLKPGGLFLNHGIGRSLCSAPTKQSFIRKYVFPDGELVPLSDTIRFAEEAGFEVRDVENLREHYAQTLRLWVERLRKNKAALLAEVPESDYRTWLLYMTGSAVAFQHGDIAVYQVLLRRRDRDSAAQPSTREHWYREWGTAKPARAA